MAARESAGILLFRRREGGVEVFLVHPGGPFFRKKDEGAWSIPKGEPERGEEAQAAALRELEEETGIVAEELLMELGSIRQKGGKTVHAWAAEVSAETDVRIRSNTFEIEWPPRSGRRQSFPEVDRGEFFLPQEARKKLNPAQVELVDRLLDRLDDASSR
jgi:predicted NUDIX family NTP pyrophosphohydrolase